MKRWKVKQTPQTKTWQAIDPHCPLTPGNPSQSGCRCGFYGDLPAAYDHAAAHAALPAPEQA